MEVKKDSNDLGSAISQSISYMNWVHENRKSLSPRINELGWDVDLDNLKLYVIAPGYRIPADELYDSEITLYFVNIAPIYEKVIKHRNGVAVVKKPHPDIRNLNAMKYSVIFFKIDVSMEDIFKYI